MILICEQCSTPMRISDGLDGEVMQTLVGYGKGPCGKLHDDNCRTRVYVCRNGHYLKVSVQQSCDCGWKGKTTCFCHPGEKFQEWPESDPEAAPRVPFRRSTRTR